jgi:hypothetical protein
VNKSGRPLLCCGGNDTSDLTSCPGPDIGVGGPECGGPGPEFLMPPLPRIEVPCPACARVLLTAVRGCLLPREPRIVPSLPNWGPEGGPRVVGEGPDGAPEGALPLGPDGTLGAEA